MARGPRIVLIIANLLRPHNLGWMVRADRKVTISNSPSRKKRITNNNNTITNTLFRRRTRHSRRLAIIVVLFFFLSSVALQSLTEFHQGNKHVSARFLNEKFNELYIYIFTNQVCRLT